MYTANARSREEYKSRVQEYMVGAAREFHKSRLARMCGFTRWVTHWESEVRMLMLNRLPDAIMHPVKGLKNRKLAIREAISEVREGDAGFRAFAEYTIRKDFKKSSLPCSLTKKDTEEYWSTVDDIVEATLAKNKK